MGKILLNGLKRVSQIKLYKEQVLLYPVNMQLEFTEGDLVKTTGLGDLDKKEKDLLHIISIKNALEVDFEYLNILSPRTYAESLNPIAPHCTAQGIITSIVTQGTRDILRDIENRYKYGKHGFDKFWIGGKSIHNLKIGDRLIIMNRRIGGWDGSLKRPVVELLGAGGHIPTVIKDNGFYTMTAKETIKKEVEEELGLSTVGENLVQLGGFHNTVSNELVILYSINIPDTELLKVQQKAYGNLKENIDGVYMGELKSVMDAYYSDASPFAGGERAKPTNFPMNKELMRKVYKVLTD